MRRSYYDDLEPNRYNFQVIFGLALIFSALICLTLWLTGVFDRRSPEPLIDPTAAPRVAAPRTEPTSIEKARIQLFKDVKDSVVNVDTIAFQRGAFDSGFVERPQGTGSGFIWDEKGHIVTNFHVVQSVLKKGNMTLRVILADHSSFDATLVAIAPDQDLAVLKIDAPVSKLKPIPIGRSNDLEVGQTVFAIGNPFGQSLSLTEGIISALDRQIDSVTDRPISGVIQTDAALNPGNSGGPLLDKDGRLIGVNTAITSPTGGSVGIGYAIPVDTVNQIVPELLRIGRTQRPVLGIVLLPDKDRRRIGIDRGVVIQSVRPDGPAAQAGIEGLRLLPNGRNQLGDIILSIQNSDVNSVQDVDNVMRKFKVGDTVTLRIQRGETVKDFKVTVGGI